MRPLFISFLLVAVATLTVSGSCLAQQPNYEVAILADGKPLDHSEGISMSTKVIALTGQLTPKSLQQYPQMKPTILIHNSRLFLLRDNRPISAINWPGKASVGDLFKDAKVGDRFMIKFEEVELQTKQGQTQKTDISKLVSLVVKE